MIVSKLLRHTDQEAEDPLESSLRSAFSLLHGDLNPPFPIKIPSSSEYSQLNLAIAFGILTDPQQSKQFLIYLHAIVVDGYELFTSTLIDLTNASFPKLLDVPRSQLFWVLSRLIDAAAINVEILLISLMRWINSGDFSENNLWLCAEILKIFSSRWDFVRGEARLLSSGVFVFLRLLADHYRLATGNCVSGERVEELKKLEILFCVRALKECFPLCLDIGRDLVRHLQDLAGVPEFRELWKDLLFNTRKLGDSGFTDISQIYRNRTPDHYFSLRVSPEMEMKLSFLLTKVEHGNQRRYLAWFAAKHLSFPGSETAIADIIRFVCCSAHNRPMAEEVAQPGAVPRWAIVGWLLKSCWRNYFAANVKLALFYDWLFFEDGADTASLEPALLLMMNSVNDSLAGELLEFLFLLVDNYDLHQRQSIARSVSASFMLLVKRGVVHSLEPLISCATLSPALRVRLTVAVMNPPSALALPLGVCAKRKNVDDVAAQTDSIKEAEVA